MPEGAFKPVALPVVVPNGGGRSLGSSDDQKKAAKHLGGLLEFVRTEGFEPPVSAFGGPRVIQLRYVRALRRYFGSSGERGAVVGRCLNRSSLCSTSPR